MHCRRRNWRMFVLASAVASAAPLVRGQIANLDKGHSLLINSGIQILGLYSDSSNGVDYNVVAGANLNGEMFFGSPDPAQALSDGHQWNLLVPYDSNPDTVLTAYQNAHKPDLFAVQVGDEQGFNSTSGSDYTQSLNFFQTAQANNTFPNQLLYVNQSALGGALPAFIAAANPDALSFDSYPFSKPDGTYISTYNWLGLGQIIRRYALGSYIGATSAAPRPYGLYTQTFHDENAIDPGEAEIRWQQFAALTMGYTFTDAFIFEGGNNHFYDQSTPLYSQYAETARQVRNLGPAMVRLISWGNQATFAGTSIARGQDANGNLTSVPIDWQDFHITDAPPNQRYLTSVGNVTNLGTKNGGHPGDVYIGFFNPLLASYGDPSGEAYFMVTNGLGGTLTLPDNSSDNTALVSETRQMMTLNFDFGVSGVQSLQRMRRSDGKVEVVPLTYVSGNIYKYTFTLDGGTGDLFKYNDGTPFVGAPTANVYWDSDASSGNNNTTTGAGLGGSGTWDGASPKWYNGSANGAYAAGGDVIFHGASGTVTLASAQTANSVTFKSGYTLTGATLNMAGSIVSVDLGATATVATVVAGSAGVIKTGGGTLVLTGANTYTGGTMINAGVLRINSDASLGAVPSAVTSNVVLNGTTLQFGANLDLNNNRAITLGSLGGTIDTNGFSTVNGFGTTNTFQGPGDLVKTGAGTFFESGSLGGTNTLWTGNLIIRQGTWKINAADGLPVNPNNAGPSQGVFFPAQVTLDGGTWQFAKNIAVTSPLRGITIAAGGGTIDTQGFTVSWAGPVAGNVPAATVTKIGSSSLTFNSSATSVSSYSGNFSVAAGTLALNGGFAMGDMASVSLANVSSAILSVAGNETFGSLAGGGAAGGNTVLGAAVTIGANGNSTTYAGVMSGAGSLTKTGAGVMTLMGANTYAGGTMVSVGTLQLGAGGALGSITGAITDNGVLAFNRSDNFTYGGAITGSGSIAQVGPGITTLNNLRVSGVSVSAGTLAVGANGGNAGASLINSLTVAGAARLDLNDNDLAINYSGNSPLSTIRAYLVAGFNAGNWNGPGVMSSAAHSDAAQRIALGYAEASDVGMTTTFDGLSVDSTTVLVKYTYYGDSNLDGKIDTADFQMFLDGLAATNASSWAQGDYTYDGKVDLGNDFNLFLTGYISQGGVLGDLIPSIQGDADLTVAQRSQLLSAVPEPSAISIIALSIPFLKRRRK